MKDLIFNSDVRHSMLLLLFISLNMFVLATCESKALDLTHQTPTVYDQWNVSPDELAINNVCRYLVENGWVSDNVDEETFHYEVTMIMQMAGQFDRVTPEFALALAANESRFRPDALSPAGARGVFQMLPSYHSERLIQYMEEDEVYADDCFYDPLLNIMAGMDYLNYILGEVDDSQLAAVMWYNEGPVKGMGRFESGIISSYAACVTGLSAELKKVISNATL